MMDDHWKPREHRFISINSIVTVPIDPANGTWLAYLSGSPAEAERGENEAEAIGNLIIMLARDKQHKPPAVRVDRDAFMKP